MNTPSAPASVLRSALLQKHDFPHAFSTRNGGTSHGEFNSLNCSFDVGDDKQSVSENRRRFAATLYKPASQDAGETELLRVVEARQVHGNTVITLEEPPISADLVGDGLVTKNPNLAVAVRTADCVPVLLGLVEANYVAAVHAGWRGIVGGIVGQAVQTLLQHVSAQPSGSTKHTLVAAVGPCIGFHAFEIGEDVAEALHRAAPGCAKPKHTESLDLGRAAPPAQKVWQADLRKAAMYQLLQAGLPKDHIEQVGGCTFEDRQTYFSHRRDKGKTGRHLAAISPQQ